MITVNCVLIYNLDKSQLQNIFDFLKQILEKTQEQNPLTFIQYHQSYYLIGRIFKEIDEQDKAQIDNNKAIDFIQMMLLFISIEVLNLKQ
ncbi:unnamed protein product [Paramecium octaurelia]|uniref:Uncharacterized protein n=1 Tax=Paramecium octaurelia TaxID=43137 RepID=A0A8S1Y9G5_PAROT|nr:unnamed protein product [Paramecium octaurelia]